MNIIKNVSLASTIPQDMKSTVGEPSVASAGDVVMYSGNWYTARSFDGGINWQHLNPFTYFPHAHDGFCCDQTLIYDEKHDVFIWLLQYSVEGGQNTLRVATCKKDDVANDDWLFKDLIPNEIDPNWNNEWFDYNHAALSEDFVYLGTNMFTAENDVFTRSVIFRIPLDELSQNNDLTLEHFESNDFSLRCVMGATDIMYFATHVNNELLRIFTWPENGTDVTSTDVPINRWQLGQFRARHKHAGNWMRRGDSRITAGWISDGVLGFAWTANKNGSKRPLPYVHVVRMDAATKSIIDEPDIWHPNIAFGWADICPNSDGDIAVTLFAGGGEFHPSHVVGMREKNSNQWNLTLATNGTHSPSDGKWGDYLHIRQNVGDEGWVSSAFTLQGGGQMENIAPAFVEFNKPSHMSSPPPVNDSPNA